jgi:hypothetical protein
VRTVNQLPAPPQHSEQIARQAVWPSMTEKTGFRVLRGPLVQGGGWGMVVFALQWSCTWSYTVLRLTSFIGGPVNVSSTVRFWEAQLSDR